jgi:hypothetical protein
MPTRRAADRTRRPLVPFNPTTLRPIPRRPPKGEGGNHAISIDASRYRLCDTGGYLSGRGGERRGARGRRSGVRGDQGPDARHGSAARTLEDDVAGLQEEQVAMVEEALEKVDVALYATMEVEEFEDTNTVFDAKNVELIATAQLTDRLRAAAEIEFERTAKTSGSSNRTGEVEVEQGWLEYTVNEAFKPRFGVVLAPFGKFNEEHFDPVRDLIDRPIVMRRIIPTTWAEASVGFTGGFEINKASKHPVPISYQAYVMNGLTNRFTDTSLRNARGAFGSDNNSDKAFAGRLAVSPTTDLELGVSGYAGNYDDDGDSTIAGLGVDADFAWKRFEFLGEYARFELEDGFEADGVTAAPDFFDGFFLQTNYHFWPRFLDDTFLGRGFAHPTFTASLRYGMARIGDDGDPGVGDNEETRWTVGFNYRPVETFVFKFDYQFNDTDNEPLERGDRDGFTFSVTGAF